MTFPTGKLDPVSWLAADATERDAIGSSDGLRVGDQCRVLHASIAGSWWRCTSVDGANSSTWTGKIFVGGNLDLYSNSPNLTIGNGLGSPVAALHKVDAGISKFAFLTDGYDRWRLSAVANEDLEIRRYNSGGVYQDSVVADEVTGRWTFPAWITIASTDPILVIDGSAGDDPSTINMKKGATSTCYLNLMSGSQTDWSIRNSSAEDFEIRRYQSDAYQDRTWCEGTTGKWTFPGEVDIDGALNHDGSTAGFLGATPITRPTVTGSRGGNAALASALTALENLGLITDSSS
jgi:predicted secreted protein